MNEQKELGKDDFTKIPNGAPGVETRLTLVYNGGVRQDRSASTASSSCPRPTPAKIFGLFPRKGTIAVGSDADIVVFDPEEEADARRQDAAHAGRLQPVRGHRVKGAPSRRRLAGQGHHRGRRVRRQEGRRPLHQARAEPGALGVVTACRLPDAMTTTRDL